MEEQHWVTRNGVWGFWPDSVGTEWGPV